KPKAIAVFALRHADGVVLIESGPGSTQTQLQAGLAALGFSPRDVTHVLLTHIHLDHAGAAGWLASQGAEIIVHPVGAPHMLNPEKLLASATRIYAERMQALWGDFLAVPVDRLRIVQDSEQIVVGNLKFVAINTPGHAEHHYAYLFEDLCFSGDVGGVRIPGFQYLRVPMPPPEFHLERWRASIGRLRGLSFKRIAPTHFGIFDDPGWHLAEVEKGLDAVEHWMEQVMPADPPTGDLRAAFAKWLEDEGRQIGLTPDVIKSYELANPLGMSADGVQRYWKKVRMAPKA
ncbi:MAG TPA: MBL fold metallo-hydrolase, partial [Anaerolineales bacterium]